jgi:hypothetical protein
MGGKELASILLTLVLVENHRGRLGNLTWIVSSHYVIGGDHVGHPIALTNNKSEPITLTRAIRPPANDPDNIVAQFQDKFFSLGILRSYAPHGRCNRCMQDDYRDRDLH